uniref:Proline rich transmembrane protein 3 n=1 Tax=Anser brachyrhynchus TaxID=132585 RepID=A0A8B9CIU4_9AVES
MVGGGPAPSPGSGVAVGPRLCWAQGGGCVWVPPIVPGAVLHAPWCWVPAPGPGTGGLSPSATGPSSPSPLFPQGEGLTMAAAWLVTWGLLLATGVPAGARGTLSVELLSDGTPPRGRVPLHALSWAHQQPVPSPAWDASGELSGAGTPDSEHWGGSSPVRWSPLPGAVTRAPRGTGMSLAGSAAPAVVEEPFIAWRGGEAEGQDSPWGGTRLPHGSAPGTPAPKVPMDTGPGSPGPPWAGQGTSPSGHSATMAARTPGPRPTVSTIALTPEPSGGTRTGTAEAHTRGQPAAPGPAGEVQELRGPPSTAPVPQPVGTGPAQGPHTSPGSVQPTGRRGDAGSHPSPSPALPSSVPLLLAEPGGRGGLLLAASLLRATLLLADPYGARGRLPPRALLLLCTAPFPLLLAAFALLLRRLQRLAQLRLLPSPLGGLPALGAAAALQSGAPAAADLLWPRLGLAAGLALHGLGCAAGALLLLLGGLRGGWRALRAPRREGPGLRRGARALLAAGALGLPCCGLQVYSALWLRGGLGPPGRCGWPCWAAQCWMRAGELGAGLALLAGAAEPLWGGRHGDAAGHSCWAKAVRYFCAGRKAQAPEYPNNCYDRAERAPTGDISKSLIRNPAEQLPLRALKDSNEARAATAGGATGLSPKCPNAAVAARERGSSASLGDLAFRPPSPIDLRRSIDQALCRRHLLREGLFGRPRRGSGASLHAAAEPPGLARCTSLTELPGPRGESVASASSLESSSLKISWNPWRHGLSSPDSLPLEEAPSRAQLLAHQEPPALPQPPDSEREARRSFLALSKQVDARSLSSDTIEL